MLCLIMVAIKIITLQEYKKKNKIDACTIYYSIFNSRFGVCLVASLSDMVCNVLFSDTESAVRDDLFSRWPKVKLIQKKQKIHGFVAKLLRSTGQKSKTVPRARVGLTCVVHGTEFQIAVWKALCAISQGSTATYGKIAEQIGNKKAVRAVGTAIGSNPIGYCIPCHRVLTSTGGIGGYRWGVLKKRAMLASEGVEKFAL
jgi:AraC family transcriptional regulator, regulatory protein of adaptative response / methylated-DNA-[protein]-cysteine methyltransferase